jgi:hypothetical protein
MDCASMVCVLLILLRLFVLIVVTIRAIIPSEQIVRIVPARSISIMLVPASSLPSSCCLEKAPILLSFLEITIQ